MPLCRGWTAPEVGEEEGSFASHFYRWFRESFEELSFCGFARFNWHSFAELLAWRSLIWLSMTWRQRYLAQNQFSQHNIAGLNSGIASTVMLNKERTVKGNKHTQTHTTNSVKFFCFFLFLFFSLYLFLFYCHYHSFINFSSFFTVDKVTYLRIISSS